MSPALYRGDRSSRWVQVKDRMNELTRRTGTHTPTAEGWTLFGE